MRDAFGGVFMIRLFLVFIFIYVAFTAVSLTYAKGFKLKNKVIDFIEQNEIISLNETYLNSKLNQLDQIISATDYKVTCNSLNEIDGETKGDDGVTTVSYCYKGVRISILSSSNIEGTTKKRIKYKVTTGAGWNLGTLNKILILGGKQENSEKTVSDLWTINGEANVVTEQ